MTHSALKLMCGKGAEGATVLCGCACVPGMATSLYVSTLWLERAEDHVLALAPLLPQRQVALAKRCVNGAQRIAKSNCNNDQPPPLLQLCPRH